MLNAEQFQENRFEEFWKEAWQGNQMPEILSKAIKDFTREAFKRGFSDAINETPEYIKYLASGRRQRIFSVDFESQTKKG